MCTIFFNFFVLYFIYFPIILFVYFFIFSGNHNWVEVWIDADTEWQFLQAKPAGGGQGGGSLSDPCSQAFCNPNNFGYGNKNAHSDFDSHFKSNINSGINSDIVGHYNSNKNIDENRHIHNNDENSHNNDDINPPIKTHAKTHTNTHTDHTGDINFKKTEVFAARFYQNTSVRFPLAWDVNNKNIPGENRSKYYEKICNAC